MYRVVPFQCPLWSFPCGNMLPFTTAPLEGCQRQERPGLGVWWKETRVTRVVEEVMCGQRQLAPSCNRKEPPRRFSSSQVSLGGFGAQRPPEGPRQADRTPAELAAVAPGWVTGRGLQQVSLGLSRTELLGAALQ